MDRFDIIIVGSGSAGLRAALECDKSLEIAVISETEPILSHSAMAQGGINAALDSDDSPEKHAYDTVKGSDYLADQDVVSLLCNAAPNLILELEKWGINFDKDSKGKIARRPFGGASFPPRAHFKSDQIGQGIIETLTHKLNEKDNITTFYHFFVVDIIKDKNRCYGVLSIDMNSGEIFPILSKAVLMATGGCGQIYKYTSNSDNNTGDSMAIALANGCALEDMEFVQFHPTLLLDSKILISEGTRAEGAILVNKFGKRFMKNYAKSMELAPRDIVSRAIYQEIIEGRGMEPGFLYLDMRPIGSEKINKKFPRIREAIVQNSGIDPVENPIPVVPCQHYMMGGIETKFNGQTHVEGLFVSGECGCLSIHGANRLGGNSLLETLYGGRESGLTASKWCKHQTHMNHYMNYENQQKKVEKVRNQTGTISTALMMDTLKEIMMTNVGIIRTQNSLARAEEEISRLKKDLRKVNATDDKTKGVSIFKLMNALEVAHVISLSALARKESRGSHYRSDYPRRNDKKYLKHTLVHKIASNCEIHYKTVKIIKWKPTERLY